MKEHAAEGGRNGAALARPNILLIMTDQQRWDSLGCYGADWVETPNLDRLAAEGVRFDQCVVNNPICTPSRASIWTGKEVPGHGVYRLYDTLPPDEVMFSQRLRDVGYHTALFGKLHTSGRLYEATNRHPGDGFDEYEWCLEASVHLESPLNGYARWLADKDPAFLDRLRREGRGVLHHPRNVHFTHWAAERTIDFIDRMAGPGEAGEGARGTAAAVAAQPFFCCMSLFDPHNPYEDYPLEIAERVNRDQIPPRQIDSRRDRPAGLERERVHSYLGTVEALSDEQIESMRLGYYASIALIDMEVGRVLQALERTELAENTLVLFVSDHGDMIGDHDMLVKGACFYDACVRVPFIARWPARFAGGSDVDALVQPHDIAATVLSAAGIPDEERRRAMPTSRDLLPLASGDAAAVRETAVCAYRNSGIADTGRPWDPPINATMIRDERYKLTLFHDEPPGSEVQGELYDMVEDPGEMDDLFARPEGTLARARLTEALLAWMARYEVSLLGSRGGERLPAPEEQVDNRMIQKEERT